MKARIVKDNTEAVRMAVEEGTKKALTSAALIVEGQAILLCPVDTGNLRSSITHEVSKDDAKVGTNVEYAPYVEMGTSRMAAQPFLRPALDKNKSAIVKMAASVLADAIKGAIK